MIYVFTGNGKGKTTSAIGQAIRVIGQGRRVAMFQFIKSKEWETGEEKTISSFGKIFSLEKGGSGFVGIMGDKLPKKVHEKTAKNFLKKIKKAVARKKLDLVILDEINVALFLKLISIKDVLSLIKIIPPSTDIILTGRNAPKKIKQIADLVTEFKAIKHPFDKGVAGTKGREY